MLENREMVTAPAPLDPDVDDAGEPLLVREPVEPLFPDGVGVEVDAPDGVGAETETRSVYKEELWKVWQLELEGIRGV